MKESLFESQRARMMEVFHQDGIVDLIGGAVLLNYGFDLLNNSAVGSLFTYIPILLMTPMKMQVTIARLGYGPFNNNERQVRQWVLGAAAVMVLTLLLLGVVILNEASPIAQWLHSVFGDFGAHVGVALALAAASALSALLTPHKRFLLYTLVSLAAMAGALLLSQPVYVVVFSVAVVMMALGLRLMLRFTRAYPLAKDKGDKKP